VKSKAFICNDCQYREHGTYKKPADSGNGSLFCFKCTHYNIGSYLEYELFGWNSVKTTMPKEY
jgi:hypothetical protein